MAQPASDADEPADMKALRRRLKLDNHTKPDMLAAAAAFALDASLDLAKVLSEHKVPLSSRGRAKALAARIASLPEAEAAERWLPADTLLLRPDWIQTNAAGLLAISTDALVISSDGQHAMRTVRAQVSGSDETRADKVVYDLLLRDGETHKAREEKHRLREKACIRRLDDAAAAAHRVRRGCEQRRRRTDEAAVRDVLEHMIVQLEQQAQREERAERQRARAERAETQQLKKKRRYMYRRAALRGVHSCDFDVIEAVEDTLDFEQEAEEAEEGLKGDADLSEQELPPLPPDPLDQIEKFGLKPTRDQAEELDRRRFMKACNDHRARLSRYLHEYLEAFDFIPKDGELTQANSDAWADWPGFSDSALDRDLGLRASRFSAPWLSPIFAALPVSSVVASPPPPPPPPHQRFWLTEAELADPEQRAQRLEDLRPHIARAQGLQGRAKVLAAGLPRLHPLADVPLPPCNCIVCLPVEHKWAAEREREEKIMQELVDCATQKRREAELDASFEIPMDAAPISYENAKDRDVIVLRAAWPDAPTFDENIIGWRAKITAKRRSEAPTFWGSGVQIHAIVASSFSGASLMGWFMIDDPRLIPL
jgi:hypothetical protein